MPPRAAEWRKMKNLSAIKYILGMMLVLVMCVGLLAACNSSNNGNGNLPSQTTSTPGGTAQEETTSQNTNAPTEDFDYMNADMSQYMSLDSSVYTNFSVTVSDIYAINDTNVKNYIDGLLKEYPQPIKITDRAVVEGDTVYIYYEGLLNGVAFQGGTWAEADEDPYALKIGSNSFIDGFEDGLIGIVPSQTSKENPVALNLTFPENYQSKDLAGKSVVFNVYIKYIANESYVPEYNEDTVVNILKFKADGDDVIAQFEEHVKDMLLEEQRNAVLAEISEMMLENITVKTYPKAAVDYWYASYSAQIQQYVDYYTQYGITVTFEQMAANMLGLKEGEDYKTALTNFAQNTVKSKMVYFYIAQQNNITVSDEDFDSMVDYFVDYYADNGYKYTESQIIEGMGESAIRENALFENVDKFLFSNCTVGFKPSESKD